MKIFPLLLLLFCLGQALADGATKKPSLEFKFENCGKLQKFVENYEAQLRLEFLKDYQQALEEDAIGSPWSLDISGRVVYDEKFTVLSVGGYDYRGGAHGTPHLEAFYFLPGSPKNVEQSTLLSSGAYQKLSAHSRKALIAQGFDTDDEWMLKGTEARPENFRLLFPGKQGLEIVFNSYQVAPYAAGTPSFTLSWPQARELFKEDFRP